MNIKSIIIVLVLIGCQDHELTEKNITCRQGYVEQIDKWVAIRCLPKMEEMQTPCNTPNCHQYNGYEFTKIRSTPVSTCNDCK